jgi:fructose-specific phosphotransferase system IIC component
VHWVPAVFSLLVAVAGFFYLQHAGGAGHLADLEGEKENALRIRLRRFGGAAMILLAIAFYVGYAVADRRGSAAVVLACLCLVVLLLPVILFLAWVDLRLTRRMREAIKKREPRR